LGVLPELTPINMNSQPYRLIAFPSFNSQQLNIIRSELQISKFSFIHGRPPNKTLEWRVEAIKEINNIGTIPNGEEYFVSTFDCKESLELMLRIYDEKNAFEKIFVTPTGSKMQAVAVGILRAFLIDIQIVFPTPRSFQTPERYTKGVRGLFRLDLDSYQKLITTK
jgi:hypothetical protein